MSKKKIIDIITIGFALFAMFFGAGNLILPPILGLLSGTSWVSAIAGFAITSVFATFLGVLAVVVSGDSFSDVGNRINPIFSVAIASICMLSIGPLVAIPRTAATTFEIGVQSIYPDANPFFFSVLFFSLTTILSLSSTKVVNIIGKFLTPLLLIILLLLITNGIINPIDSNLKEVTTYAKAFASGFREGYQTMDLLASFIFAGIIIAAVRAKGYNNEVDKKYVTFVSALIATTFLLLIYAGLVYLGATSGYVIDGSIQRTELLLHISNGVLGANGTILLALCVGLACLTTAIALTSAVSDYFSKLTNNFLTYRMIVLITGAISGFLSIYGVDKIIDFAFPFLAVVYPIAVCMAIYLVFFGKFIKNKVPYKAAIFVTFIISIIGLLANLNIAKESMLKILDAIPLNQYEIPWLIPSAVVFGVFAIFSKNKNKSKL